MTEANFSDKGLSHFEGAQILAAFMSTKLFQAKGVLSQLDLSRNWCFGCVDKTTIKALAKAIKASSISDLNLAGNGDAGILAEAIQDMGALASLTISSNYQIGSEQKAKIKEICAGRSIKCAL